MQQQETSTRVRGHISRVMRDGYAFVTTEDGEECFLHLKEFRKAERQENSGKFVSGTFLEFTREEAKPRPRAVKVKVLS